MIMNPIFILVGHPLLSVSLHLRSEKHAKVARSSFKSDAPHCLIMMSNE